MGRLLSLLLRRKVLLVPVVLGFLATPFPQRWGVYEFLFTSWNEANVGFYPLTTRGPDYWNFGFEDLYDPSLSLKGQRALVTGANSGIGFEVSLALARLGAKVTLACRNYQKCEDAAYKIRTDSMLNDRRHYGTIQTMVVDTSSLQSVKDFCDKYMAKKGKFDGTAPLDILYLNAGFGGREKGVIHLTKDGIEEVFATNVVGHHLMYTLLRPLIFHPDRTTPARIILTSSTAAYYTTFPGRVPTDLESLNGIQPKQTSPYSESKLAQILWAKELTARLDDSEPDPTETSNPNNIVYANAAHPGTVATSIWDNPEKKATPLVFAVIKRLWYLMWTPAEGALTLLYLGVAVSELQENKFRGQYFHPQSVHMVNPACAPDDEETRALQKRLWDFLDDLVAGFVPPPPHQPEASE